MLVYPRADFGCQKWSSQTSFAAEIVPSPPPYPSRLANSGVKTVNRTTVGNQELSAGPILTAESGPPDPFEQVYASNVHRK